MSADSHIMAVEIILLCTAVILFLAYALRGHLGRQPPSNRGSIPRVAPCLPYFGNALHLDMAKCHLCLSELRQKYGPVFSIRLFKENIVVLNDSASIHEALIVRGSDYAGRPPMYRTTHAERHKHSIVWQTYTQKLVFLRKSVLKSLRMYGSGLRKLEGQCEPDIRRMCDRLAGTSGQAVDPSSIIYDSVCSVMLGLVSSLSISFHLCYTLYYPCREIRPALPARAGLPSRTSACWVFAHYCECEVGIRVTAQWI